MKKIRSIVRIAILLALGITAMLLIFGKESSTDLSSWILLFMAHKAIGICAIILIARLYTRWSKVDPWLICYKKMCEEVDEKPNPMCIKDSED